MKLYSLANSPVLSYIALYPILYRIFCCLYRIFQFSLYCNTTTNSIIPKCYIQEYLANVLKLLSSVLWKIVGIHLLQQEGQPTVATVCCIVTCIHLYLHKHDEIHLQCLCHIHIIWSQCQIVKKKLIESMNISIMNRTLVLLIFFLSFSKVSHSTPLIDALTSCLLSLKK